jgi:hypothetical protein
MSVMSKSFGFKPLGAMTWSFLGVREQICCGKEVAPEQQSRPIDRAQFQLSYLWL